MLLLALCQAALAHDADAPAEPVAVERPSVDELHDELRAVRSALLAALESRDIDALVATLHPDIVLTTTTGEVARGHQGIRDYADRMLVGDGALVQAFDFDVTSDELSIFHNGGDTAIAWGPSADAYTFGDGSEIVMNTRWSATLVREGGTWRIVNVHSSLPAFDNVVLEQATAFYPWVGGGGLAVGAIGGLVLGLLVGRRRS